MINVENEEDQGARASSEIRKRRLVRLLIGMHAAPTARPMLRARLLCERLEVEV